MSDEQGAQDLKARLEACDPNGLLQLAGYAMGPTYRFLDRFAKASTIKWMWLELVDPHDVKQGGTLRALTDGGLLSVLFREGPGSWKEILLMPETIRLERVRPGVVELQVTMGTESGEYLPMSADLCLQSMAGESIVMKATDRKRADDLIELSRDLASWGTNCHCR